MTAYSVLTSILPIVVLTFAQNAVYPKKQNKAKFAIMIPLALLYSIIGVLIIWKYHIWIEVLLKSYGFIEYSVIVSNMVLMITFIVLKIIVGALLKKNCSRDFVEATAATFYSYVEEYDKWFLQYRWTNFRVFLNTIRWGSVIAAGLFLSFVNSRSGDMMITLTFPCSVVIVFNEAYYFINGETREEFEHSISGDKADSRRAGEYFRIREILERVLPEPLLSSLTGFELAGNRTPADFVKTLSKSDDKFDKVTADYFLADNRYMQAEADGIRATLNLMHGKNVLIHNPFYRDLDMYVTLPLFHSLVCGEKTVVITGRMSAKEDVKAWVSSILEEYTHMPSLWRVGNLNSQSTNCDIGVLSFPDLYDPRVIENNRNFFKNTKFVILIEPSAILSTGQIALSIISQEMEDNGKKPVYLVSDRMADGLVDTISHLLRTEFVEVVAPPVPHCTYSGITWNADGDFCRQQLFDRQTRYLGDGIEIAAIAIKNQIPHVSWYGETKVPMRDIKWIAGQNYPVICQYMNQPSEQHTISERISFVSNLWGAEKKKEQFAIVEDEINNMFMTMRMFISRGMNQSFINVLSETYLLRDYMRCNQQMFLSNPDAIPSIVPDYAKSERNTLIKLLLLMRRKALTENEIISEYHLVGKDCGSAYSLLDESLKAYTSATADILNIDAVEEELDELTTEVINTYAVSNDTFRKYFEKSIAEAFFLEEEEVGNENYLDAKFFSLVTQCILPGQYITYNGKYYIVKHISPETGVVLRRAADLFDGRRYYRQIRKYYIGDGNSIVLSSRLVGDVEFTLLQNTIKVSTFGYLDMDDLHDLRMAKVVDLSNDPLIDNFSRCYRNKTFLRIRVPETDENTRFTFCVVFSELLRSLIPDGYQYIAVSGKFSEDISGLLSYLAYPMQGDLEEDCIYIIEDSDIDLGLLDAIERNWDKIMDIMGDFLSWHFEKMREPAASDPIQPSYEYDREKAKAKKQSWFANMAKRLSQLVPSKKEEPIVLEFDENSIEKIEKAIEAGNTSKIEKVIEVSEEIQIDEDEASVETVTATDSAEPIETDEEDVTNDIEESEVAMNDNPQDLDVETSRSSEATNSAEMISADHEISSDDGTDIFDETGDVEDDLLFELEFAGQGLLPIAQTRYRRECFLKFGYDEIDNRLVLDSLMQYLRVHGRTNNALTHARKREIFKKSILDTKSVNRCDFCGRALSGVSYELMNDGRVRCNDCSASAITSVDELKELFYQALDLMEAFFSIKYRVPIHVKMADARTVAKGVGMVFRPSTEFAARVLGYAQKINDNYSLIVENGSPRLAALETMVHELTHIWQYINWGENDVSAAYDMGDPVLNKIARDIIYEGMAVWTSIQYLYQIGESLYASEMEMEAESRIDVYGFGFILFREQYPLVKDASLINITPFASFPPLDPERVKEFIMAVFGD